MSILDWPLVARTRRNHGLEHATVHILSERHPGIGIIGRSTPYCYYIYGNLTAEQIQSAAAEALIRLRAGESHLAIHPGCGTNLVVSGTLAGAAAFTAVNVGHRRDRDRWDTLPFAMAAATVALLLAQPLGPLLQERITTSADMGAMEILGVWRVNSSGVPVHRVDTRS
jgi:hypothetical protein